MITKKKIILSLSLVAFTVGIIFIAQGVLDYKEYRKTAEAAGAMPWQDGGKIMAYIPACTPLNCYTPCVGQSQISYNGQIGGPAAFMCVPVGFVYQGGGTIPMPGMDIIAGGVTNIMPWVVGIPGASASRVQKIADTFKLIIAGIKE